MGPLMETVDFLCRQMSSGRWILTVAAAIILIHWSWAMPTDKIDKLIDLIKDIVIFYFVMRPEPNKNGGQNGTNSVDANVANPAKPIQG